MPALVLKESDFQKFKIGDSGLILKLFTYNKKRWVHPDNIKAILKTNKHSVYTNLDDNNKLKIKMRVIKKNNVEVLHDYILIPEKVIYQVLLKCMSRSNNFKEWILNTIINSAALDINK